MIKYFTSCVYTVAAQPRAFWTQIHCFHRGDELPHLSQIKYGFAAFQPTWVGCSVHSLQCEKGHCYLSVEMTTGTVEAAVAAFKIKVLRPVVLLAQCPVSNTAQQKAFGDDYRGKQNHVVILLQDTFSISSSSWFREFLSRRCWCPDSWKVICGFS